MYFKFNEGDNVGFANARLIGWLANGGQAADGNWAPADGPIPADQPGDRLVTTSGWVEEDFFPSVAELKAAMGADTVWVVTLLDGKVVEFSPQPEGNNDDYADGADGTFQFQGEIVDLLEDLGQLVEGHTSIEMVVEIDAIETIDEGGVLMLSDLTMTSAFTQESNLFSKYKAVTGLELDRLWVKREAGATKVQFRGEGLDLTVADRIVIAVDPTKNMSESVSLQQQMVDALEKITDKQAASILLESTQGPPIS
mgnify:CR=1 FL=1